MKRVLILLGFLLVITAITFGVLRYLNLGPFELPEASVTEEVTVEEDPEPEPPRYMNIDHLAIPIFRAEKVVGTIQIQLKLAINPDAEDELMHLRPRLANAFLTDLYGYLPRAIEKQETLDIGAIKRRLQRAADRAVGPGKVEGILIQSIMDNTSNPTSE